MPKGFSYAGWHLAFDGVVEHEHAALLNNMDYLRTVMLDLVEVLDMTVLIGPQLSPVRLDLDAEPDPETEGITGVVLVTSSHIAIHTWPLRNRFSLCVFSSKEFDKDVAEDLIKDRLHVTRRSAHWIHRIWPD